MAGSSSRIRWAIVVGAGFVVALSVLTSTAVGDARYQTVADGLRNPRGVAVTNNGKDVFVAEAGEAGDVCFEGSETEEGGPECAGFSSRISRVDTATGARDDVVTGLLSLGGPLFAIGATGVVVDGNGKDVLGLMGANGVGVPPAEACGATPDCLAVLAAAPQQLGHVLKVKQGGSVEWKQDVGADNYQWTVDNKATIGAGNPSYQPSWSVNPDFQPGDANPYGFAGAKGGTYMVDGGSNTLTWIPDKGKTKVVVAFPDPVQGAPTTNAYDAVPTCVAPLDGKGKGDILVADLNGRIFVVDGSSLTVAPDTVTSENGAFLVAAGGCAADKKGNAYITDIFAGSIVKLDTKTMTLSWVLEPGTLNFPSGVGIGKKGALYVANNGVCPSFPTPVDPENPCGGVTGSLVRVDP